VTFGKFTSKHQLFAGGHTNMYQPTKKKKKTTSVYMYCYSVQWSAIGSFRTTATNKPIVPALGDYVRNWCNGDWQGKPKYLVKTCLTAALSTTNPACSAQT
jgi:hypothetical protein